MINQSYTPSSNGLESFIEASPDYELAPIGLGSMRDQAEKLAEYGRYGDIYVVHAAEGETVVPMEVLEANPKIKSLLFDQMSQMGLDPERYVVGNDLNSLNPVTGMPEFFFKKLWKSVKKYIPVVAPIIGNMIAPGIGGLIATGLATKFSGGTWGDALKATAMAWGTQAVLGGFNQMGTGGKGFGAGFMQGARAPIDAAGNLFTGWKGTQLTGPGAGKNPLAQGIGSGLLGAGPYEQGIFPTYDLDFKTPHERSLADLKRISDEYKLSVDAKKDALVARQNMDVGLPAASEKYDSLLAQSDLFGDDEFMDVVRPSLVDDPAYANYKKLAGGENLIRSQTVAPPVSAGKLINPITEKPVTSASELLDLQEAGYDIGPAAAGKGPLLGEYSPSKFLGLSKEGSDVYDIGLGLGATYLLGGFDEDEPEQPEPEDLPTNISNQPTAEELLAADPDRFRIGLENLDPNIPVLGETEIPSMFAAQGGTVNYPRRTGQINGPGTGTSDSIPAMLSNGEFVMTKRAVEGAGGPGTMYDLMRNFEMRT